MLGQRVGVTRQGDGPVLLARHFLQNGGSESVLGIGGQLGRLGKACSRSLVMRYGMTMAQAPCPAAP